VSGRFLNAALEVVEKVARGASDKEIDQLLDNLNAVSVSENNKSFQDSFSKHVRGISRVIGDSFLAEKGLSFLIETTQDLSNTLELQELLRRIVSRARSLVGANVAWVTILDNESLIFRTVTAEGNFAPATAQMTSRLDHGAVSLIMNSKSYFETQDYLSDQRFRHSPDLDRTFQIEKIVSLAGFPILWESKVHGFLFVADRYVRKLTGREMSVLSTFALPASR
jgi:transcriptional regulator with GAF, ATPase, and Fis domain